jgi:hypothetical protein
MAAGQFVQMLQQQRAAAIQATMAEHARQADDLERAFGQRQRQRLRQAFQRAAGVGHGDLPQLAMARAVELARLAERVQLLGGALDTAFFLPTRNSSAPGRRSHGVEQ